MKFRIAYTAQNGEKRMIYDDNRFLIGLDGKIYENYGEDWKNPVWEEPFDTANPPVLQQYTEAKDVNGKFIYDGDIIKCKRFFLPPMKEVKPGVFQGSGNDIVELGEELGIVFFSSVNRGWCVEFKRHDDFDDLSHYCAVHRIEVMGNTFENEDLVKWACPITSYNSDYNKSTYLN